MADFNWNIKATIHQVSPSEIPQIASDTDKFLRQRHYNHGDLIRGGDYRMATTFIVIYDNVTDKYGVIENPDTSGSGYLTLPEVALSHITDAVNKYSDVIHNKDASFVNFRLSSKDKFVVDRFGSDLPDGWRFDLQFTNGRRDEFLVSPPGKDDWHPFDADAVNWQSIVDYFEARTSSVSRIRVQVDLSGEDLKSYKAQYGHEGQKYGWMTAKPQLPAGWRLEKAGSSGGGDKFGWLWVATGPDHHQPQARHAIQLFLQGFQHQFIQD